MADPAGAPLPMPRRRGGVMSMLRPKGNLSRTERRALAILAILPILSVALRSLAFPGLLAPGWGAIQGIGNTLSQIFSLNAIPPDQRDHALYLLFVPTSALLVALARLTFGIRVLGFRSILISVGFHQSGLVSSLLLISVAVATIVLVRPWLRRIRLPYYARVSVILCIVAITMVGALLAAPWMRSDVVWGAAYFPVIVLAMLAEGVAHTLDRDNVVTASWRAITTVLLAFVIAIVGWVPPLRSLLLQFPELVLTETVAIVMISEFLDLRLLQGWDARVAETLMPRLVSNRESFRVAVVRNRPDAGGAGGAGRATRRREALRSVQKIVNALRRGGHVVKVMEGDASLVRRLRKFLPPNAPDGETGGIVLNLAHGIRGDDRSSHVPAMLEMSGIPYVGPTPMGHAMAFDRVVARALMQEAGVPTPAFRVLTGPGGDAGGLRYPLAIRPRREPNARVRIARDPEQLRSAVRKVVRRHGEEAFVEEHVSGRHVVAALLGNAPVRVLPLVQLDSGTRAKVCPAPLDEALAKRIRGCARRAFRACGCRDYARVDLRVGEAGEVWVLGVGTLGILAAGGSFARAGRQHGLPFGRLVRRIVEVARTRGHSGARSSPVRPRSPAGATADLLATPPT